MLQMSPLALLMSLLLPSPFEGVGRAKPPINEGDWRLVAADGALAVNAVVRV